MKRRRLSNTRSDSVLDSGPSARFRSFRLFLLGLLVCALALPVQAGSEIEPVTFAVADVWPWGYEDQSGTPRGSLMGVMHRLSELTGVPVKPRMRPVRRAISELHNGEVNFSILFQSPDLDQQAVHIAPVVQANILLAAKADTHYPLTLESLAGKSVAYIRGTYLGEAFERNTSVVKVPVTLISQAVHLLSLGRISAILASDHAILRTLETMGVSSDTLRYTKHVPGQAGVLYMSSKAQRPKVAMKYRKAIEVMAEKGELESIFFGESGRPQYDGHGEPFPPTGSSAQ